MRLFKESCNEGMRSRRPMEAGGEGMPDFEEIYRAYLPMCTAIPWRFEPGCPDGGGGDPGDLFRALTAIDGFGECQIRVWLCQIARNQYLSLCRERRKFASRRTRPGRRHRGGLRGPGDGPAAPPAASRPAGALQGGLFPADLRRAALRPDRGTVRKNGNWARVTYFRARQKAEGGIRWNMRSFSTCCPCTTTAYAQMPAAGRWRHI